VARPYLAAGAVMWATAGLIGLALAVAGADLIASLLPGIAIDPAAIGGSIVALSVACLVIASVHAVVVVGLGSGSRWALSSGVLLAGLLGIGWLVAAAALLTSGAAGTIDELLAAGGAALCVAIAAGYGLAAARLAVKLRRTGSVS
jgi:hypothetical protein